MKYARVIPAVLALALASQPVVAREVQWTLVHRGSFAYFMPPADCRVGPLPEYEVQIAPQSDLDASLPPGHPAGEHIYGIHSTVGGMSVVYISAALPHRPPVYQDTLQHELAHLRGCEHGQLWGG